MPLQADLVLLNGNIHTLDPEQPLASALAVYAGKIVYVGDEAGAREWIPCGDLDRVVDLKGACVLPGLTDAHIHFQMFSLGLQQVNAETETLGAALSAVARHAARKPAGSWILGFGWNHNVWGGQFPTAADLDRVAPNHPVVLGAKSGHAAWVNTRALQAARITAETGDPPGGEIVRDAGKNPSGVLLEEAMNLVYRLVPEETLEESVDALREGMRVAHRAGLTGVHDMDGVRCFQAFQILRGLGELTLRAVKSIPLDHLEEALGLGLRSGFGDDWLRIGGVKMFADGALGPRTAWMLQPFETAPRTTGIATTDIEVIHEAVNRANAAGLAANIHAIGDRANREVLNVYAEVRSRLGNTGLRNRIEHVQLLHPDDYGRLAELGVVASMQPIHATSDMHIADKHWGKRSAGGYALKTQLDRGAVLALGSDCPVETLDPLQGIHAAVTRRRADGSPGPEGWYPEQRLTVEQAVRGFTSGPAYAAGMENRLGSLSPGKLADLTILDQDIFAIDPMDILHTSVLATLTGGRFAFRSETL